MNSVVEAVRQKHPGAYDDLSDDQLTEAIGKMGAYLDVPDFAANFNEVVRPPSLQTAIPGPVAPKSAVDFLDSLDDSPEARSAALARPPIVGKSGELMTVRSIGLTDDQGQNWVVPTIINGRQVSNDKAMALWRNGRNPSLNIRPLGSEEEANQWAQRFHEAEAQRMKIAPPNSEGLPTALPPAGVYAQVGEHPGPSLREVVGQVAGLATTPLLELAKPVTSDDLMTLGIPEGPAKVLAGAQQSVADSVNFFMSPLGVATLGIGYLPKAAQKAVSGVFLADMVRQYPAIASNLAESVRKGDLEGATKWATTGALNTLFVREGVKHIAQSPQSEASQAIGYALQKHLDSPELKKAMEQSADQIARENATPRAAPLDMAAIKLLARTREPVIEDQPANLVLPGEGTGPANLILPDTMRPGTAELETEMADLGKQMQAARIDGNAVEMDRLRRRMTDISLEVGELTPGRPRVGLDALGNAAGDRFGPEFWQFEKPEEDRAAKAPAETTSRDQATAATEPAARGEARQEAAGQVEPAASESGQESSAAQIAGAAVHVAEPSGPTLGEVIQAGQQPRRGGQLRLQFATVTPEAAARIKAEADVDAGGAYHVIDDDFVRKTLKEHGDPEREGQRGNIAVTAEDFQLVPEIVADFDTVKSSPKDNQAGLQFTKRFNGTTYYIATGPNKNGRLLAKTMWKKPSRPQSIPPEGEPPPTSKPLSGSSASSSGSSNLGENEGTGKIHSMAAGAGPSPAAQRAQTGSQPPLTTPNSPVLRGTAAASGLRTWWASTRRDILKLVGPQAIDAMARRVANIVREYNAEAALKVQQLDAEFATWRRSFDRTPVPRNWSYDPAAPLPRNYAFMDESEHGGRSLSPDEQRLKARMDAMFDEMVDDVHAVAPRALQSLIQDYFPHLWQNPKEATRVFNEILSKRPLEGSKAFLKQRTKRYFRDGLEAGLIPASDNPIDLVLQKSHEIRKFIAAQKILQEAKDIGARKFVYVFERPPEGWTRVNDPTTAVHAPPFVTVQEAFDAQLRTKTLELLEKLGVPHERLATMRGKRWGESNDLTGEIKTRFAGPDFVIWHELGHQLESRYRISSLLADTASKRAELSALAKLREMPGVTSAQFRRYAQSLDEKMATVMQAYVHAPDLFERTAPTVYRSFRDFIQSHPELRDIDAIQPSLQLGTAKASYPVGGMVTLGHWYMPEGAAAVLNNYLSPGLGRFGLVRTIRTSSNLLNGAQLGFSAFHVGFTSLDASVSRFAVGLQYLSDGRPVKAAMKLLSTPAAPVTNWRLGRRVQREMLSPGSEGPEIATIAQLAVTGGLRATIDPFWKTEITRKLVRALHQGGVEGYGETVLRSPFALLEQLIRPITEWIVPRQKLGVFAEMAKLAMDRLGPNATHEQIREAMAKAADSTENRMGQMTYDNLFYNRIVKDLALTGFRAYGWQLGKYREAFGAAFDTVHQAKRLIKGEGFEVTHRMAYAVALPMVVGTVGGMMHYMMTGQAPQNWKDLFFPRTGKTDENGREQRLMLPSYLKDLLSDWHDFPSIRKMGASFYHKLNPGIAVTVDMLRNKDFYDVRIYNEDDPTWRQVGDLAKYALKSATPFSVTGAQKLHEEGGGTMDYVPPFFGIVPAKRALTMTPAEALASDLIQAGMPSGSRTQEEFDRSKLLKQLTKELKADRAGGIQSIAQAVRSGQIRASDINQRILPRLMMTPLEFQISSGSIKPEDAMRVWDLSNPEERQLIRDRLLMKVARSQTLEPETRKRFVDVIVQNKAAR